MTRFLLTEILMLPCAWLLVAGLFTVPPGPSGEQYQLRLRPAGRGHQTAMSFDLRCSIATKKRNAQDVVVCDELENASVGLAFTDDLLEQQGNTISRFRRHFTRGVKEIDGEEKKEAYEGKTYLHVIKDGKLSIYDDKGSPVPEEELQGFERAFAQMRQFCTGDEKLLPPGPVRVGEVWKVDAPSWGGDSGAELELTRATGQLVKVYRKDGHLCGVIEHRIETTVKSMPILKRQTPLQPGSKLTMKTVLEGCLDGASCWRVERFSIVMRAIAQTTTPDNLKLRVDQLIEANAVISTK